VRVLIRGQRATAAVPRPSTEVPKGHRNSAGQETLRNLLVRKFCRLFSAVALCILFAQSAVQAQTQKPPQPQTQTLVNYSGISIEPSEQLFATLCALDAAGFAADESTLAEIPSRLALREDLLKMHGPATEAVRQFYRDHLRADPGETLSLYVTFALVAGPAPDFKPQMRRELLPPEALAIDGFQTVLAAFYREAGLRTRWQEIEPGYARVIGRYDSPVRRIVTTVNAYLREILKPSANRDFTVYVEPLVGSRTNFRNVGDHYAIVVGASSQIPTDAIQHAYLHFKLDPLPLQYADQLRAKKALLNLAARAPRLPVEFQNDFVAFADECFVKAVEIRLRRLQPAALESALADADQSGFTLVRPFAVELQKFEKAEPAMSYYFPAILAGLDVEAEQKRLANVKFSPVTAEPEAKKETAPAADQPTELDAMLAKGNREIAAKDAPAAEETFEKILADHPDDARALYGLAIASVLGGQAGRAKELFEKLVSAPDPASAGGKSAATAADPTILAWSHVYLGRIDDLEGDRETAVSEYHSALTVVGAPEAARVAAERGVQESYDPRAKLNDTQENRNTKGPQQP
jgi:tetratricopeptide (TPR) repeat protein